MNTPGNCWKPQSLRDVIEISTGLPANCVRSTWNCCQPLELPFAALQQLCAPGVEHLDELPRPQRDALRVAFGLAHGLVVALPVLTIFGAILGWLRWRTDSVYPPMLLHATFNGFALAVSVTL